MPIINDNWLTPTRADLFGPPPAPKRPAAFDLYGPVHKGLRLALCGLLTRLGAQDWTDAESSADLLDAMRAQLEISAAHLRHEEEHVHRLLDTRLPEGAVRPRHQHEAHDAAFSDLALMIEAIAAAPKAERPPLGRRLYLRFSTFVAEDFEHMAEEEQAVQPMLQALLTDAEMQAIEAGILAAIPPARAQAFLKLMLPAMSPPERAAFVAGARAHAPDDTAVAMIEGSAMVSRPRPTGTICRSAWPWRPDGRDQPHFRPEALPWAGSVQRDRAQTESRRQRDRPWREGRPHGCAAPAV